jgi:hypothetical protein
LIARYVTPEFVKRIAAEQRKGRRLLIGTTHLDAQRPVIWDMGGIAIRDVGRSVSVDYHFVDRLVGGGSVHTCLRAAQRTRTTSQ